VIGKHDPRHTDLDKLSPKQMGQLVSKHIYISFNSKTGVSVNSRISETTVSHAGLYWNVECSCHPTQWCTKHCYARHGHFATWDKDEIDDLSNQQTKYLVNSILFNHYANAPQTEVDREADSLVGRAMQLGFNNVRWNGGGDLSRGAVRLINSVAARYPNFRIWGFSRRSDLLNELVPSPNVLFTVSLDPTTPPLGGLHGDSLFDLVKAAISHGGRMAYATEVPNDSLIPELDAYIKDLSKGAARLDTIFGEHMGPRHTVVGHPRECPATQGKNDVGCQSCQWCFMSESQRRAKNVTTPREAFLLHKV